MGLETEIEFSVKDFLSRLKKLTKETKKASMGGILNRETGNRVDFSDEVYFFKKIFPKLEELYDTTREKGIMEGYIRD